MKTTNQSGQETPTTPPQAPEGAFGYTDTPQGPNAPEAATSQAPAPLWTPERKQLALAELARWHGVKHVNRVAVPGVGIDCIHLVFVVYVAAGLLPRRRLGTYNTEHGLFQHSDRLRDGLLATLHAVKVAPTTPEWGDIAIFKTGRTSAHCGFLTRGQVWHALAHRCVTVSEWHNWEHRADCLIRLTQPGFKANPAQTMRIHGR